MSPHRILKTPNYIFITQYGLQTPFSISSAPEHFQKNMSEILVELEGILCQMDDIFFAKDQEEHNVHLRKLSVESRHQESLSIYGNVNLQS